MKAPQGKFSLRLHTPLCSCPASRKAYFSSVSCIGVRHSIGGIQSCSRQGSSPPMRLNSWSAGAGARFIESGGVYKLAFGPKAFIVVSDPVVVRHLLKASPRWVTGSVRFPRDSIWLLPLHSHPYAANQYSSVSMVLLIAQRWQSHLAWLRRRMHSTTTRGCWRRSWSPSWARGSYLRILRPGSRGGELLCLPSTRPTCKPWSPCLEPARGMPCRSATL